MATVVDWPTCLKPTTPSFSSRGMTISGPPSLTGRTQVVALDAGYWTARLSGIPLHTPDRIRAYRALIAKLEGGAIAVRVPAFDKGRAPWPLDGMGAQIRSSPPVYHSNGAGYANGVGHRGRVIAAVAASAAAMRSTSIVIDFLYSGEVRGGELFSLGAARDRLHVISAVTAESGTTKTVSIWPPLRETLDAGADIEFDRPVCRMRLADEAQGDFALNANRRGTGELSFIEVF